MLHGLSNSLISQDRATASVVSQGPLTADASGAFQSSSCEICSGQTSIEIGFSPNKTLDVGIRAAKFCSKCLKSFVQLASTSVQLCNSTVFHLSTSDALHLISETGGVFKQNTSLFLSTSQGRLCST